MRIPILLFVVLLRAAYAQMDSPIVVTDSSTLPQQSESKSSGRDVKKASIRAPGTTISHGSDSMDHGATYYADITGYSPVCYVDDQVVVNIKNQANWSVDIGNVKLSWDYRTPNRVAIDFGIVTPTDGTGTEYVNSHASGMDLKEKDGAGKSHESKHDVTAGQFVGRIHSCQSGTCNPNPCMITPK